MWFILIYIIVGIAGLLLTWNEFNLATDEKWSEQSLPFRLLIGVLFSPIVIGIVTINYIRKKIWK